MKQSKPVYMKSISLYCELKEGSEQRIGHMVKLALPVFNTVLAPDLSVYNPENDTKETVNAIIDTIMWDVDSRDHQLYIKGLCSAQSKATLQEILIILSEKIEVAIEFIIYEYDLSRKRYFKRFYTDQNPVQLVLSDVYISEDACKYQDGMQELFLFTFSLNPKELTQAQELYFTFSAGGNRCMRQIG